MNEENVTPIAQERQAPPDQRGINVVESAALPKASYRGPRPHRRFSASDKRLILKASIKLFARRLEENLPVTPRDLNRLAAYGDRAA